MKLRLLKYFTYFYHDKFIYLNTSANEVFKIKCFMVALYYTQYKHIYIIWMKALLGNELNDFSVDTLCFL